MTTPNTTGKVLQTLYPNPNKNHLTSTSFIQKDDFEFGVLAGGVVASNGETLRNFQKGEQAHLYEKHGLLLSRVKSQLSVIAKGLNSKEPSKVVDAIYEGASFLEANQEIDGLTSHGLSKVAKKQLEEVKQAFAQLQQVVPHKAHQYGVDLTPRSSAPKPGYTNGFQ